MGIAMFRIQAGATEGGNIPKLTLAKSLTLRQIEQDAQDLDSAAITHPISTE
jgi:hypothetical protein